MSAGWLEAEPIRLRVEIRRNADGAMSDDVWPDWKFNEFWWRDGNAECDCNRELFFQRARGEQESDEPDCGSGAYSVRLSNADTGEILYTELPAPPTPERTPA